MDDGVWSFYRIDAKPDPGVAGEAESSEGVNSASRAGGALRSMIQFDHAPADATDERNFATRSEFHILSPLSRSCL